MHASIGRHELCPQNCRVMPFGGSATNLHVSVLSQLSICITPVDLSVSVYRASYLTFCCVICICIVFLEPPTAIAWYFNAPRRAVYAAVSNFVPQLHTYMSSDVVQDTNCKVLVGHKHVLAVIHVKLNKLYRDIGRKMFY